MKRKIKENSGYFAQKHKKLLLFICLHSNHIDTAKVLLKYGAEVPNDIMYCIVGDRNLRGDIELVEMIKNTLKVLYLIYHN